MSTQFVISISFNIDYYSEKLLISIMIKKVQTKLITNVVFSVSSIYIRKTFKDHSRT